MYISYCNIVHRMLLYIHKHVVRIQIYACERLKQIRFKHNNITFYAMIERYTSTSMKSKKCYCCVIIIITFIFYNSDRLDDIFDTVHLCR